ncbi:MAG: CoA-binding protein [Chloroflexota bacterium]
MQVDFTKMEKAFNPKTIAVVGDSKRTDFEWLRALQTYKGKVFSVQVNPETIKEIEAMGVPNYTSLVDIPGPIDLVIVSVPRAVAMQVLEDCIRKQVGVVHFYTSGFSETGSEDGRQFERVFVEKAKAANLHVVGPNCRGIFVPGMGIKQHPIQYSELSGALGFISQSGNHAILFSQEAYLQGLIINKSVSFGNGIVLDSADYLEFFGNDPAIKAIGMYLEGIKDGRRFLKVLKEVSTKKPVVVWKGGRTAEGGRAIASHTGSLAVSQTIWDAAMQQCGVVGVTSMEELIDTLKALLYLPPVSGDRVAIAGGSGGQSVAITDVFAEAGLKVPTLTEESYAELASFFRVVGASYRNPIDTGQANRDEMGRIIGIVERDANIDNMVFIITMHIRTPQQLQGNIDLLVGLRRNSNKPMASVIFYSNGTQMDNAREVMRQLQEAGIAAFPAMERGARALYNALRYYRFKQDRDGN